MFIMKLVNPGYVSSTSIPSNLARVMLALVVGFLFVQNPG
jgi:hypothetical protein